MKPDCKSCGYNDNDFCVYHGAAIAPDVYSTFASLGFPHFKDQGEEKGLYVNLKGANNDGKGFF